jgi:cytoplasmic iron level regulating protein YaaA (DUF328/UPF0246 family)
LISPAKKLECNGWDDTKPVSQPRFLDEAAYLVNKLQKKSALSLSKMMGISRDLATLNEERFKVWTSEHGQTNSTQAMLLFQGDVYQGLSAEDFNKKQTTYAQEHLRIVSGLYGVLKPLDAVMPYRLEMGSDFKVTPAKKNLYAYWGDQISNAIQEDAKEIGTDIIVNLASNEYSKAAKLKQMGLRVISTEFKEFHKGDYKMISFFAKKARGLMARYAIKNSIKTLDDLKHFDLEGYHFSERFSKGDKWVFTREQ